MGTPPPYRAFSTFRAQPCPDLCLGIVHLQAGTLHRLSLATLRLSLDSQVHFSPDDTAVLVSDHRLERCAVVGLVET